MLVIQTRSQLPTVKQSLSIRISSCGFEFHVAIKAIVLHCNYYLITFFINESIHSCKPFLQCFILQLLIKLCDLSCELCVCPQIRVLNLIRYQSLGDKALLLLISPTKTFFLSNLLHSYSTLEAEGLPLNTPI